MQKYKIEISGEKMIETERLILRELVEEDAEEMFKNWASDDEVSKYVRWTTHKNVEETKEYIKCEQERCKNEGCYNWGIVLKENQELIGAIIQTGAAVASIKYESFAFESPYLSVTGFITEPTVRQLK